LIAIVLTAFFSSIADIVGTVFKQFLLKPVWRVVAFLDEVVESISEPIENGLTFEPALGFSSDFGYVAGLLIVIVGAYIIARAVGVVRGETQ
jgi:hypothetical protein